MISYFFFFFSFFFLPSPVCTLDISEIKLVKQYSSKRYGSFFLITCKSRIHKTLFHFCHSVCMRSTHAYSGLQDFISFPIKYHNRTVFYIRLIAWAKSWITSLYSIVAPELIWHNEKERVRVTLSTLFYIWQLFDNSTHLF